MRPKQEHTGLPIDNITYHWFFKSVLQLFPVYSMKKNDRNLLHTSFKIICLLILRFLKSKGFLRRMLRHIFTVKNLSPSVSFRTKEKNNLLANNRHPYLTQSSVLQDAEGITTLSHTHQYFLYYWSIKRGIINLVALVTVFFKYFR